MEAAHHGGSSARLDEIRAKAKTGTLTQEEEFDAIDEIFGKLI
jgi:hypothetical protein